MLLNAPEGHQNGRNGKGVSIDEVRLLVLPPEVHMLLSPCSAARHELQLLKVQIAKGR